MRTIVDVLVFMKGPPLCEATSPTLSQRERKLDVENACGLEPACDLIIGRAEDGRMPADLRVVEGFAIYSDIVDALGILARQAV